MTRLTLLLLAVAALAVGCGSMCGAVGCGSMCGVELPPGYPPGIGGTTGTGGAVDPGDAGAAGVVQEPTARCQFREVTASTERAVRRIQQRVIGGDEADLAQYTGLCSLQDIIGRHYCSCTVLAPGWVLAAGHCQPEPHERVVAGRANLNTTLGQVRRVSRVLEHELYEHWSEGYDLILVQVNEPFVGIEPIPLSGVSVPGAPVYIAGWGRTCSACPTSPVLLEAEATLLSRLQCQLSYPGSITHSMLCASAPGRDAAPGDSGGFLGQYIGGVFAQVGVGSWGRACTAADPGGDPDATCVGVYANLAGEVDGIRACIQE
jgi:hypothetical protein